MKKKHLPLFGLGLLAAISIIPIDGTPLIVKTFDQGGLFAQNVTSQPNIKMELGADQKMVQKDDKGKEIVTWKQLQGSVSVKPGEELRYILTIKNVGNAPAKNLSVAQPIPKNTIYVLNSANIDQPAGVTINYSIDGGRTFVPNPTIEVIGADGKRETRPAPAQSYTDIQWKFTQNIDANTVKVGSYQVKVR